MSSKTAVTELVRKKKRTQQGKSRKKENAKKGTINYFEFFETPAQDERKKTASKK